MANVKVIYGSSTGNTESAAAVIAGAFGTEAINITNAKPEDFEAGLLILGSSTWGLGELQDDWATGIAMPTVPRVRCCARPSVCAPSCAPRMRVLPSAARWLRMRPIK